MSTDSSIQTESTTQNALNDLMTNCCFPEQCERGAIRGRGEAEERRNHLCWLRIEEYDGEDMSEATSLAGRIANSGPGAGVNKVVGRKQNWVDHNNSDLNEI